MNNKLPKLFTWRNALISKYGPGATTRHVLLTLSLHMDENGGSCFPSTRTLAAETCLSLRTVCTHLDIAENEGWINKMLCGLAGQNWKRNKYNAEIPPKVLKEIQQQCAERDSARLKKVAEPLSKGAEPDDIKVLKEMHSSTSYNSSKNSSNKYTSDSVEYGLSKLLLNLILQRNPKYRDFGFAPVVKKDSECQCHRTQK